jgi:hypothetical protein
MTINPTLTTTTIIANSTSSPYNTATNAQSRAKSHTSGTEEGEEEIIVLDKENVNPGVFRRKGEKGDSNSHSISKASQTEGEDWGGEGSGNADATGNAKKTHGGERCRAGVVKRCCHQGGASRRTVFVDLTGTHAHNDTSY